LAPSGLKSPDQWWILKPTEIISKQSRLWFVDTTDVAKGFHSVLHNSMYTIVVVRKEGLSIPVRALILIINNLVLIPTLEFHSDSL